MTPGPPSPPAPPSGDPASDFDLVPLRQGRIGIRSRRYQEVCHPGVGPAEEAEQLYVSGLDLPRRWREGAEEFVVWDVGLGGGANAVAVLAAARRTEVRLRLLSFDHSLDPLAFAFQHREALGYFQDLDPLVARFLGEGAATLDMNPGRLRWDFVAGDFAAALTHPNASPAALPAPQAILFDPHSPRVNPEMWTLPLFTALRARVAPALPCTLATYSRSTSVRVALLLAGWWVGTGSGTGTKEETTVAATDSSLLRHPLEASWLGRARRSGAAEPWVTPPHHAQPLSERSWEALQRHPQFAT
ncbi:MAG: hypothetical protein IT580_19925 [Verrucomicrobiales bacterium]|nr:hypothetical protein [Verrucomicrobiales bacterium]